MQNTEQIIYEGKEYDAYTKFESDLSEYQAAERQDFVYRRGSLLHQDEHPLKYLNVTFECSGGEKRDSKSKNIRAANSMKRNCPAVIKLSVNRSRTLLIVREFVKEHKGHPELQEVRDHLPKNRALRDEEARTLAIEYLGMRCSKVKIQRKIEEKTGKQLYMKDLHNLNQKIRNPEDDTLNETLKLLENKHNASIYVLHCKSEFQGLFFVTDTMIADMKASPEIVFTDGTYKLFKRKCVLQLFMVEDNYGQSQVVGAGILANETRLTVKWLFEVFEDSHGIDVTKKIHCFMTDKDLVARAVIKEVFSHVATILCQFHTKKTFKLNITAKNMEISCKDVEMYLELMNKMCESYSEKIYDQLYEEFTTAASENSKVMDYFNNNWHCNREEWTTYGMNRVVNLGNLTNNRMESNNAKLKNPNWMQPNDVMVRAVSNLMDWVQYRKESQRRQRIREMIKLNVRENCDDDATRKYRENLTTFAFEKVNWALKKYRELEFEVVSVEEKKCKVERANYTVVFTPTDCTCPKWVACLLVCKHILAAREHFHLPIFDLNLCTRWCKSQLVKHQNTTTVSKINIRNALRPGEQLEELDQISVLDWTLKEIFFMVCNCRLPEFETRYRLLKKFLNDWQGTDDVERKLLRTAQKKTLMNELVENLRGKILKTSGENFDNKLKVLQKIKNSWTRNEDVLPDDLVDSNTWERSVGTIDGEQSEVDKISLPPQIKFNGKQKKNENRCTPKRTIVTKKILTKNRARISHSP